MSAPFNELPLSESALSFKEAVTLNAHIDGLKRFLGAPGDWGYDSMLGRLAIAIGTVKAVTEQHIVSIQEANPDL
ncbi:MAG: hypothetical protein JSR83_09075 [Proteobacteria bacterium]|nr:hypothetical protein [Pseudomonadota bacterium]